MDENTATSIRAPEPERMPAPGRGRFFWLAGGVAALVVVICLVCRGCGDDEEAEPAAEPAAIAAEATSADGEMEEKPAAPPTPEQALEAANLDLVLAEGDLAAREKEAKARGVDPEEDKNYMVTLRRRNRMIRSVRQARRALKAQGDKNTNIQH